ncbi:MAG: hypothetical protein Q9167_002113 [Letrouitia subvulpina]
MRKPNSQMSSQINNQKAKDSNSLSILETRRAELQRQEDIMKGGITYGVATNKHYRSRSFVPEIMPNMDGQDRQEELETQQEGGAEITTPSHNAEWRKRFCRKREEDIKAERKCKGSRASQRLFLNFAPWQEKPPMNLHMSLSPFGTVTGKKQANPKIQHTRTMIVGTSEPSCVWCQKYLMLSGPFNVLEDMKVVIRHVNG